MRCSAFVYFLVYLDGEDEVIEGVKTPLFESLLFFWVQGQFPRVASSFIDFLGELGWGCKVLIFVGEYSVNVKHICTSLIVQVWPRLSF